MYEKHDLNIDNTIEFLESEINILFQQYGIEIKNVNSYYKNPNIYPGGGFYADIMVYESNTIFNINHTFTAEEVLKMENRSFSIKDLSLLKWKLSTYVRYKNTNVFERMFIDEGSYIKMLKLYKTFKN